MVVAPKPDPPDPALHLLWPLVVVLGEIAVRVARQRAGEVVSPLGSPAPPPDPDEDN